MGRRRSGRTATLPAKRKAQPVDHIENQWARAIPILLSTPVLEDAAKLIQVDPNTLRDWRRNPAFLTRLANARDEMLGHAMATLGADYGKNLTALREIRDRSGNPIAKYMAAAKLMDSAVAQFETEGLLQRFARQVERGRKLEARLVELGDEVWLRSLDA